ncbi:MAG: MmgE/PrpD family protein [Variovorax sp.]|nr:MmgE/PrpD family protein [Variovorax sp.]
MSSSLTQGLGRFVAAPPFEKVPDDVAEILRNAFIDTVACFFSGREEAVTRAAFALARRRGGAREARVLLGDERLGAMDAAFVNAVSAHALDYDDMALNGHPSVVLVPALLACGERAGATDDTLMRAYLVGYEVWAELIGREPDSLHSKGWHPTSVLGTVAVAAAVAHLQGLGAEAASHALGIAASQSCGLMGNFGSMTKPLHAGWAASHGIEAAELAGLGVTASANVLESATGLLAALSPQGKADRGPWDGPADLRIRQSGLSIKKYPVCYAAHRVIDGVLDLKRRHGFRADQVRAFVPTLSDVTARVLHASRPTSALEAKFSIEFACAMAALEGAVGLAQVTDDQVARADLQALMAKVRKTTVPPGCPIEAGFALHDRVQVELNDGTVLDSGPIRFARGHARLALPREEIVAKWQGCLASDGDRHQPLLERLAALGAGRASSVCTWLQGDAPMGGKA